MGSASSTCLGCVNTLGERSLPTLAASGWLRSGSGELAYSVEGGDVHALMEVCHDVGDKDLDLILHSPGGSPQAAEQMLNYLRTQFDHIRAIVPLQAKSAATMMALGCDEIVMGDHSELPNRSADSGACS